MTSRWSWAIWGFLAWHLATCAAWWTGLSGLALAMTTLGAIALAALAITMHRRLDRGLARLSTFFARADGGETDLSRELPEETAALSPALVEGYRQFVGNLRRSTDETRTLNIRIAQDAAYVKLRVGETAKTADRQGLLAADVARASDQSSSAIQDVTGKTRLTSSSTSNHLGAARTSLAEMIDVETKMDLVNRQIQNFSTTVDSLSTSSASIGEQVQALMSHIRIGMGDLEANMDRVRSFRDNVQARIEGLRTYCRDTGEIVTEMAMPIHVSGRLWGNVRVGLAVKVPDE